MEKEVFVEIYEMIGEVMELALRECYEGLHVKTLIHLPHPCLTIAYPMTKGFPISKIFGLAVCLYVAKMQEFAIGVAVLAVVFGAFPTGKDVPKHFLGLVQIAVSLVANHVNIPQILLTFQTKKASTSSKEEGFITLEKVRWLLSSSDATEFKGSSSDTKCRPALTAGRMKKDPYWSVWKKKVTIPSLPANVSSSSIPLREGKKTHVFLSHDWGIDGNNHHRVKQVSDALKGRGLVIWVDDDPGETGIKTELDPSIASAIEETECMLVFITENYRKKVNGQKQNDYCKMEFSHGFHRNKKMIPVVLESSMTNREGWDGLLGLYLCRNLHYDLSQIFESSSCQSKNTVEECMEGLFQRIVRIINEGGDNKSK